MQQESNKELLLQGIRYLALALPLIFTGPALYFWLGATGIRQGNYLWAAVSLVVMGLAVFLTVRGLRTLLKGFFGS